MPDEIELKLVAPAKDLRRLSSLPWVRAHAQSPAICQTLISVYYDTEKGKLREKGISLRIRRVGAKRVQTIKSEIRRALRAQGMGKGDFLRSTGLCTHARYRPGAAAK